jgi:pseudouridine synthase
VEERLQKAMARAGVASRRQCEELILAGRVAVNGHVVTILGTRVDAERDEVAVDGVVLRLAPPKRYFVLHKPDGVLTTAHDPHGRRTVMDLIDVDRSGLFPVGRLDQDTDGFLLITNDGELAFRLTHPSYEVPKTYEAEVRGRLSDAASGQLRRGVRLEDGVTAPARDVEVLRVSGDRSSVRLTIHEGRKREVRRMLQKVGHPVVRLKRVAFAGLRLGALPVGQYRPLTEEEIKMLHEAVGLEVALESTP